MSFTEQYLQKLTTFEEELKRLLFEDKLADGDFAKTNADIDSAYKGKLQKLENVRTQKIQSATFQANKAEKQLLAAMDMLGKISVQMPPNVVKKFGPKSISGLAPANPNFQELSDMINRITDTSLKARLMRTFGVRGYYTKSAMVRDFVKNATSGKAYLNDEMSKGMAYVQYVTKETDQEFQQEKAEADRKKDFYRQQNNEIYDKRAAMLQQKLVDLIESPALPELEEVLTTHLEKLGAFSDNWDNYEPPDDYPGEFMLGALSHPFSFHPQIDPMLQEKLPVSYSGNAVMVPLTVDFDRPIRLLIRYDTSHKKEVMNGIQAIILKVLRYMPPSSFFITCIDPNERGTNFGELQKLSSTSLLGVYTTKEDIIRKLKELERFVDQASAAMAGIESIYAFNREQDPPITHQFIIINDYPDGLERNALESLAILKKNAEKCGISIIITTRDGKCAIDPEFPTTVIDAQMNSTTILYESISHPFSFDDGDAYCGSFVELVRKTYAEGLKVDNAFCNFFDLCRPCCFRDSSKALLIPFAVDNRKHLIELELGGPLTAHAILSGSTGSGKSTTLHMLISSIVLNYHPDDVELWLVDYKKVEFAEYKDNPPLHVKLLALERTEEFTFSLLETIDTECQKRLELFKQVGVNNITEYKLRFGVRSLSRIVLIIDEFHNLTQAIQSEPHYVRILENILSEYRVFGLSCVFSDQAISDGLRGLTEKGKKQIRTRIAMANDMMEVKETLALDSSYYDDSLRGKINRLDRGDVIFKRMYNDEAGELQTVLDKYRTILSTREERVAICEKACREVGTMQNIKEPLIVDSQGRITYNVQVISAFEEKALRPPNKHIPICVGTPANLSPIFHFELREKLDANIMIVGANDDLRGCTLLYAAHSFARQQGSEVLVCADRSDELFHYCRGLWPAIGTGSIRILSDAAAICAEAARLSALIRDKQLSRTMVVWLGLEAIVEELSILQQKNDSTASRKTGEPTATASAIDDILGEINAKLLSYGGIQPTDQQPRRENTKPPQAQTVSSVAYDARDDIQEIISKGPRYGVFNIVTYSSVKMIRQVKVAKSENFEHKIAFSMSMEDSSAYLGKGHYASGLDELSGVYYDGGTGVKTFRPYLLPQKNDRRDPS